MIPIAPTAQCSRAPPVNMLYKPRTELPVPACLSKKSARAPPLRPGTLTTAAKRQTARTSRVKRIRDFSSGILKQFRKVSAMAAIMGSKSEIRNPNDEIQNVNRGWQAESELKVWRFRLFSLARATYAVRLSLER